MLCELSLSLIPSCFFFFSIPLNQPPLQRGQLRHLSQPPAKSVISYLHGMNLDTAVISVSVSLFCTAFRFPK